MEATALRGVRLAVLGVGLLAQASLLAQTNAPSAPPKTSAWSVIENAAREAASKQDSTGPLEIVTDTMGVDFNPYLRRVLHDVKKHWYELITESASTRRGKVVLDFSILKEGSVAGLRVAESSGDIALDRARLRQYHQLKTSFTISAKWTETQVRISEHRGDVWVRCLKNFCGQCDSTGLRFAHAKQNPHAAEPSSWQRRGAATNAPG